MFHGSMRNNIYGKFLLIVTDIVEKGGRIFALMRVCNTRENDIHEGKNKGKHTCYKFCIFKGFRTFEDKI